MSFTRAATALLAIGAARAVLVGEHDSLSQSPADELILAELQPYGVNEEIEYWFDRFMPTA